MSIFKKWDLTLLNFFVCLVFFVTPIESVGIGDETGKFSIAKLVVLLLLVVWILKSRHLDFNPVTKLFISMGGFWLLSCVWAISPSVAFDHFIGFYLPSLVMVMIIGDNIHSYEDVRNILVAYMFGCIVLALFCISNRSLILANATYADMERVSALGQDQNELSFLLSMGLAIVLHGIQVYERKGIRFFLLACAILFILATLLTGSRTGAVMMLSVVVLFVINNKKYSMYLLPLLIIASPIIISKIPTSSIERILNTKELVESGDLSNRGIIWENGLNAYVQENVLLGVGYQNFPELMHQYYGYRCAAHNTYISYLCTGGIIGLLFLMTILVKLAKYCTSFVRETRNSYWYAYILPLLLAMITLETQYRRWIFLIAIVIFKTYQISKQDNI